MFYVVVLDEFQCIILSHNHIIFISLNKLTIFSDCQLCSSCSIVKVYHQSSPLLQPFSLRTLLSIPQPRSVPAPLSGQMTQAMQQAHNATLHWQGVTDSAVIITHSFDKKMEEEPASKKIKLEVVEVYLPEEETEADLELDSSVFTFSTIIKVCDLGGLLAIGITVGVVVWYL